MKLMSCDNCGVILDLDKIKFPTELEDKDGAIDPTKADYDQKRGQFFAYINCPVCNEQIFEE